MYFPPKIEGLFKFVKNKAKTISLKIAFRHPKENEMFNSVSKYKNLLNKIIFKSIENTDIGATFKQEFILERFEQLSTLINMNLETLKCLDISSIYPYFLNPKTNEHISTFAALELHKCLNLQILTISKSLLNGLFIEELFALKHLKSIYINGQDLQYYYHPAFVYPTLRYIELIAANTSIQEICVRGESATFENNFFSLLSEHIEHPLTSFIYKNVDLATDREYRRFNEQVGLPYILKLIQRNKLRCLCVDSSLFGPVENDNFQNFIEALLTNRSLTQLTLLKKHSNYEMPEPTQFEIPLIQTIESFLTNIELTLENCSFSTPITRIVTKLRLINLETPKGYIFVEFPPHLISFHLRRIKITSIIFKELVTYLTTTTALKNLEIVQNIFPTTKIYTKKFLAALSDMQSYIETLEFIQNDLVNLDLSLLLNSISRYKRDIKCIKIAGVFELKTLNQGFSTLFHLGEDNELNHKDNLAADYFTYKTKLKELANIPFIVGFQLNHKLRIQKIMIEVSPFLELLNISNFRIFTTLKSLKILSRIDSYSSLYEIKKESHIFKELLLFTQKKSNNLTVLDIQIPFEKKALLELINNMKLSPIIFQKLHLRCFSLNPSLLFELFKFLSSTKSLIRVNIDYFGEYEEILNLFSGINGKIVNSILQHIYIPKFRLVLLARADHSLLLPKIEVGKSLESMITQIAQGLEIKTSGNRNMIRKVFGYDENLRKSQTYYFY